MKASELKRGNYIALFRKPTHKVKSVGEVQDVYINHEGIDVVRLKDGFVVNIEKGIEALEINEKILHQLGFKITDITHNDGSISKNVFKKDNIALSRSGLKGEFADDFILGIIDVNKNINFISWIYHVHNLQNFFQSIKHKELTLEL